ncbi:MAG TPA: hypothetical protein VFM78_06460 [Marinobacter sp.]|nr:hypothetical protein [Marinobacter sp.]
MATHAARSDRITRHTRQDLFGFSHPAHRHASQSLPATAIAIRQLWIMGLHIREPNPGHWVVRGSAPLPEVHLYSEQEVQHFATCNAVHYSPAHRAETTGATAFDTIKETA